MTERTPKTVTMIQMAPVIDGLHDDFTSRSRLPYPFYVDDDGFVQLQDLWQGHVYKVIGFQNHPSVQRIDLWWADAVKDVSQAVGKYLVTSDADGNWGTFPTACTTVERTEAVV